MPINLPEVDDEAICSLEEAKEIIRKQRNSFEQLFQLYGKQQEKIILLEKEIARLKHQPHKPQFGTQNQSFSAPKQTGKQWQKGKRGKIEIDTHMQLPEVHQCSCGSTVFETITTTTKVVQGLVIKRNNTAYHGRRKKCIACGKVYATEIPSEVKGVSFDPNTRAIASFLRFSCRLTHPLLYNFFTGFGMRISYGELTTMLLRNSQKLHEGYLHIRKTGIYKSHYLQSDATGAKRKQKATGQIEPQFLHIVGNTKFSLFKITKKYNSIITTMLLGKQGRKKIYLSDDASANGNKLQIIRKQLCLVHEIRHYRKLSPRLKIHRQKQQEVITQWQQFYHLAKEYGHDPTQEKKDIIRNLFNHITTQTTGYEQLDNQLALTKKKRKKVLLFLDYPIVPIHNNQAERDLREFVIMRNISGETKSLAGDRSIERHLSIIQTAKKQGLNVFETLQGLLTNTLPLQVLTANIT